MNIFENRESIIGSLDSVAANGSLVALFQLAKRIRALLGKQAYLLDCYLSMFFEALTETIAFDAADEGFLKSGELQSIFLGLLEGTEQGNKHPLHYKANELFAKQADKMPFQEDHTKLCLLMILLADEMMAYSTEHFLNDKVSGFGGMDEVLFQQLYDTIADVVGEAMLDELNEKLKQRFLLVPLTTIFAQAINNDLFYKLTTRDFETSKQMFQLLIDMLPDAP